MNKSLLASLALGALLVTAFNAGAGATTRGKTQNGLDYATGGVTVAELRSLAADRDKYGLWVTTAAKGSGAFLSDVRLRITDATKAVVLDTTMTGPWLFVDLAPGRYTIEATMDGQEQTRKTQVEPGAHHQAILYFESPAQVSPDWVNPFKHSPYATD